MNIGVRDSGVGIIGDIPWGTHSGQMYSTKDDFFEVALNYIRAGLLNNELCIWVYADNTSLDEIRCNLREYVSDVDSCYEKGQLRIISYSEWYLEDNDFNEVRVNKGWSEFVSYAANNGYDGLRAVGDTSWLEKSNYKAFFQYEQKLNSLISELPFLVLCLYDANKLDAFDIAEIISNHSFVIAKQENELRLIKNVELIIKNKQLNESKVRYKQLELDIKKNKDLLNYALECDKMKTEFFSNISHELRTPLNVIMSALQLLKLQTEQSDYAAKGSKYLNIMQQNCFRLLRLVNNLIDITKIDADYFELKLQNYDIISHIRNITLSVVEYASNRGIMIYFDTNSEEKIIAYDPDQIERIILNLLSNAIKFTHAGGEITVSIYEREDYIEITVKDTGIGIPADMQGCIFERFVQADKSLKRECEGSGIGLSLVKALVEKHDGEITLVSKLGMGSEFKVILPCKTIEVSEYRSLDYVNSINHVEKVSIELSDIYS